MSETLPAPDPLRSVRFWFAVAIEAVFTVLGVVLLHRFGSTGPTGVAQFIPLWLYLVPVVYAAQLFGTAGGLSTAVVASLGIVPWIVHAKQHSLPGGPWVYLLQMAILLLIGIVFGAAVTMERRAKARADEERTARIAAEERYHHLFETNSEPLLIVDANGAVQEGNEAAVALFGALARSEGATTLDDLVGPAAAASVLQGRGTTDALSLPLGAPAAASILVRAVASPIDTVEEPPLLQVVLRDVTDEARKRQRMEAYAADVIRGQEDERRRIAQELHDGPLQALVHLCRELDDLADREPGVDVRGLRQFTESTVSELRDISRGLRPPALDDLGLAAVLQRLCDETEHKAGVAASLRVPSPPPALDPNVELAVYRIAQEALSNVTRHAHASTVDVVLERDPEQPGALHLVVRDDGEGFTPANGNGAPSEDEDDRFGIVGMTERAQLVGGSLTVRSRAGEGTTVECRFPEGQD